MLIVEKKRVYLFHFIICLSVFIYSVSRCCIKPNKISHQGKENIELLAGRNQYNLLELEQNPICLCYYIDVDSVETDYRLKLLVCSISEIRFVSIT